MKKKRVKTPTLIQMEAVECGAAALGIILSYYKKFITLEELRQECGISRDGGKASSILKAARKYNLDAKGLKKEIDDLADVSLPFIVFWNFNHFIVVEGFKKDIVYINDPATGPRKITFKEFDEGFTGVVLSFKPAYGFKKSGQASRKLFSSFKNRLSGSKWAVSFVIF
ncbi:NHLP family bacteriocin export ABC transporter peptidase/permease/ATPase, partial [bacterium]|nr:NHLP family bacteriocin export ABC transporter peptidase/permease/ATPase [bacterium]